MKVTQLLMLTEKYFHNTQKTSYMKNTVKFLALAGLSISLAACNKAKFVDEDFVSFGTNRVSVTEDVGILTIPVALYGADECVVTYVVTDETAKAGVNYEVVDRNGKPNKSGVLTLSNSDKAVNDSIRVRITDLTGTDTGNLTFSIALKETSEDAIVVGAFNTCICTIVDNDGGLTKLLGSYAGTGTDTDGAAVEFEFDLEEYNPAADPETQYPKANCMLTNGKMLFTALGNNMTFAEPLYAYFDSNMAQLHVYGLQPFNRYNFGDPVGVCYVAWGNNATSMAQLLSKEDIIINAGDGSLELAENMVLWLLDQTGAPNGYNAGDLKAGYKWTK